MTITTKLSIAAGTWFAALTGTVATLAISILAHAGYPIEGFEAPSFLQMGVAAGILWATWAGSINGGAASCMTRDDDRSHLVRSVVLGATCPMAFALATTAWSMPNELFNVVGASAGIAVFGTPIVSYVARGLGRMLNTSSSRATGAIPVPA